VATRKQIKTLAAHNPCPPERAKLEALSGDDAESNARYREEVLGRRKSIIDLLEESPACEFPFNVYLEMLSPLRPRYYSISSSPLADSDSCHITVAVVEGPARSGSGIFKGVCSNYLKNELEGQTLYGFVRDVGSSFRLPENPHTPVIMVGPGTGLAPFRGFLQERAALKAQGVPVGDAALFFGCRHPQQDFLYRDELEKWAAEGVTELYVAFSREEGKSKTYVQHVIEMEKDRIWELLDEGAHVYVCGDATRMAPDVRRAFGAIYQEKTGASAADAEKWLDDLANENRYLVDVWAAN
jgi:cytochrome P450 / NADPH-cytochrome P450 reductase